MGLRTWAVWDVELGNRGLGVLGWVWEGHKCFDLVLGLVLRVWGLGLGVQGFRVLGFRV